MDVALLDTDILSEVIKQKNSNVLAVSSEYLIEHPRLAISVITYFEIVRGLVANRAERGLADFVQTADELEIIAISIPILRRAADLWAEARHGGYPRGDADLIIAATALETKRVLVTGNKVHFAWISNLITFDWRSGPE